MRNPFHAQPVLHVCSALLLAVGVSAATAASKSSSPADSAAITAPGKHPHMECMGDSAEMAKLRQTVQEALKSGDKGKMKSALEKVDAHFADMQEKMDQCRAMMKKGGGAMMEHDDDMMCGKDHEEEHPKGGHPDEGGHKHPAH